MKLFADPSVVIPRLEAAAKSVPRHGNWEATDLLVWKKTTKATLETFFGGESSEAKEFEAIYFMPGVFINEGADTFYLDGGRNRQRQEEFNRRGYERGLAETEAYFAALIQKVRDHQLLSPTEHAGSRRTLRPSEATVFLVHGHDDGAKHTVARFLEKFGLAVTILHEQPSKGRTIIEKLEDYADVAYAVVLLTPDDLGKAKAAKALEARARQNVILEMGWFLGTLGRKHVSVLVEKTVERPSDYQGVEYINFDKEDWRIKLANEIRGAGIMIDMATITS